jgi:hypothetical protein
MPIGSMIAKFRDEFEAHMEAARLRAGLNGAGASASSSKVDTALAAQGGA